MGGNKRNQLYFDQHITKGSKTRRKNYAMAWINNKKIYNIIQQNWIIVCLKISKISGKIINFIMNAKEKRRKELTVGGQILAEVKINWGIFLKDSLSPLLFIRLMMLLSYLLRKYRGGGNKFTKSQENINHVVYGDDIKISSKKKK